MKKFFALALLFGPVAFPAFASCNYPKSVPIPDGKTAALEEMVSANKAVKQFNDYIEQYLGCIKSERDVGLASPDSLVSIEKKKAMNLMHAEKNNAAIDELVAVAARLNDQIRIYKATAALRENQPKSAVASQKRPVESGAMAEKRSPERGGEVGGDGSVEHTKCVSYGLRFGTADYADCRYKLEAARQDAARIAENMASQNKRFEEERQRYEIEMARIALERRRLEQEQPRENNKKNAGVLIGEALQKYGESVKKREQEQRDAALKSRPIICSPAGNTSYAAQQMICN
jgi:hypothetical protein